MKKLLFLSFLLCISSVFATIHLDIDIDMQLDSIKKKFSQSLVVQDGTPVEFSVDSTHVALLVQSQPDTTVESRFKIIEDGRLISAPCLICFDQEEAFVEVGRKTRDGDESYFKLSLAVKKIDD